MKTYEIWLGNYHLGQGFHHSGKSERVAVEKASSFEIACLKYELRSKLKWVEENDGVRKMTNQDIEWWYNPKDNSNSWTGKYYPSKEEADKSFK